MTEEPAPYGPTQTIDPPAGPPGNGQTVVEGPALKRIPESPAAWLPMPEPYSGLQVKLWLEYSEKLWQQLGDDAEPVQRAALRQIVREHDGWADAQGALPQPSDDAFWDRISLRLLVAILAVARTEAMKPPPALAPRTSKR